MQIAENFPSPLRIAEEELSLLSLTKQRRMQSNRAEWSAA